MYILQKLLEQHYESRAEFIAGPSVVLVFQEETIYLQLYHFGRLTPLDDIVEKDGWRMTPLNSMKVWTCCKWKDDIITSDFL